MLLFPPFPIHRDFFIHFYKTHDSVYCLVQFWIIENVSTRNFNAFICAKRCRDEVPSHRLPLETRNSIYEETSSVNKRKGNFTCVSFRNLSDCMELTVKAFECRRENHFHSEAFRLRLAIEFKTETFPPLAENVKLTLIFIWLASFEPFKLLFPSRKWSYWSKILLPYPRLQMGLP